MASLILFALFITVSQKTLESLCFPSEVGKVIPREIYLEERIAKASQMRSYMNESVNPCSDFYSFSCGNWATINSDSRTISKMKKTLDDKVKQVLQSPVDSKDNELDRKVKAFYRSCINYSKYTQLNGYYQDLSNITNEFGGMPAVMGDDWNENNFDWFRTIVAIKLKYNKDIMLQLMFDSKDQKKYLVGILQPALHWDKRPMYVDEETYVYRSRYIESIQGKLYQHLNLTREKAANVARSIVDFEKSLAAGMYYRKLEINHGFMAELTTMSEMNRKYGSIMNFEKVIEMFDLYIYDNDAIYEFYESYLRNLISVLKDKPKDVVANYIMYNVLELFFTTLTDDTSDQENHCIERTREYFTSNVYNMIYRRYNTEDNERDTFMLWQEIKESFKELMQSKTLNWISHETRQKAIEKLDSMKMKMDYKEVNYTQKLTDLQIKSDDYFRNMKSILRMDAPFGDLYSPEEIKRNKGEEGLTITPYYDPMTNTITMPLMLLEHKFFPRSSYPRALKFATIGTEIGHELTHGFDDQGRYYDISGEWKNWWDEDSKKAFEDRKKCFIDQYIHYELGNQQLPKSYGQGENIADAGAVHFAYNGYLRWLESSTELADTETLPSMNYNSKQLFFISYAQTWCSYSDPSIFELIMADVHPPDEFRVIGPLSNFPEFAKEFNCGPETPMNRGSTRCEIY